MQKIVAVPSQTTPGILGKLSLNLKICLAASLLLILSLGITSTVIGRKNSSAAEAATMELAHTATREVSKTLQNRIASNVSVVRMAAAGLGANLAAGHPPSREQLMEQTKALLDTAPDFIGSGIFMEPNALDGRDAEFAGKSPVHDKTGRFSPYFTRGKDGSYNLQPNTFDMNETSMDEDWYAEPKKTGKAFLTEPYEYPVDGQTVLMVTLSVPIMVNNTFRGLLSAEFALSGLSQMIADLQPIPQSKLALIDHTGMYAAHSTPSLVGKKTDDIPPEGLRSVAQGKPFTYSDDAGQVHLLQPLHIQADLPVWAVRISFPQQVAAAAAQEQFAYALVTSVLCAVAAAVVMVILMNRLMQPLRKLGNAVADLSSGDADLTARLQVRGNDELARISAGFNAFMEKILRVLAQVQLSTQGVANASAEIAQGNQDLSARTERQASTLEETASSMDALNATVKQNATHAQQANQLATQASTVATQGGDVVGQVVDTMKGINEASRKISDIISVIDGIAFQTNILALNAAVEAARAGEQGRGFAVVASEVRSLAGRSADAAKEIKSIVQASVQRVEAGSALVDKAGDTMVEVVQAIRRVTHIMGEISAASSDQASSVAQVSEAMTQMDQVTQQNAALMEHMAAAASHLNTEVDDLVQAVGVFKLGDLPVRKA